MENKVLMLNYALMYNKLTLAIIKQLIKLMYYFFIINYLVCFMLIYSHASTAALDSGSNETPCEDFNILSLEKQ